MANTKLGGIGVKHTKHCITCGVKLNKENWYASRILKKEYRCKSCFDLIRIKNKIKQGYKSPSLFAKCFGLKHKVDYDSVEEGDVYIITNPSWKGWIKVGKAINALDRCKSYQSSSPLRDYKLYYSKFFKDRTAAEKKAHALLKKEAEETKGEWFKIKQSKAKKIIETI